jgi:hypothetical protein
MPADTSETRADQEYNEQTVEAELPSNQTAFAEDLSVISTPGMPPVVRRGTEIEIEKPKRSLWIGVGFVTVVALGIGVIGIWRLSQPALDPTLGTILPTPSPSSTTLDPVLQQQLDDLELAINGIDPTTQRFVFPPVNLELELETSRR